MYKMFIYDMKAISLFSGAGGDSVGMERAGVRVVAFSEMNKDAIATHRRNLPHSELIEYNGDTNIKNIPSTVFEKYKGYIDIVFAGFPCQGFSRAGKKKMDDPRNELVYEFIRVVDTVRPKWIIGENVTGLLSRKGTNPQTKAKEPVINIIRTLFQNIGYHLTWNVYETTVVGVPQKRKRLIILGSDTNVWGNKYPRLNVVCETTNPTPSIRPFLEPTLVNAVRFPTANVPSETIPVFWIDTPLVSPTGTPHPNLLRLVAGIRNKSSKEISAGAGDTTNTSSKKPREQVIEKGGLISFGRRVGCYHGEVVHPDHPSKTIICNYGLCPRLFVGLKTPNNEYYIRTFTETELAQIQGFPKTYEFIGNTKSVITQIGNAVPPDLVKKIVESLYAPEWQDNHMSSVVSSDEEVDDTDDDMESSD